MSPTDFWTATQTLNKQIEALIATGEFYNEYGTGGLSSDNVPLAFHGSEIHVYKDGSMEGKSYTNDRTLEAICAIPTRRPKHAPKGWKAVNKCWVKDTSVDPAWHPIPKARITVTLTPTYITASYVNEQIANRAPAPPSYYVDFSAKEDRLGMGVQSEAPNTALLKAGNWFYMNAKSKPDKTSPASKPLIEELSMVINDIDDNDPAGMLQQTTVHLTNNKVRYSTLFGPYDDAGIGARWPGSFTLPVEYGLFAGDR